MTYLNCISVGGNVANSIHLFRAERKEGFVNDKEAIALKRLLSLPTYHVLKNALKNCFLVALFPVVRF